MGPNAAFLSLWALLAVYSILMGIDLGAGALLGYSQVRGDQALERVVEGYATPIWEAVHTFLILLLLGMEAFFPKAINTYANILLVPLGLTFVLLILRQAGFALRHERPPFGRLGRYLNPFLFGVLGPLVPLPAMTFFTVLQGRGFVMAHGLPVYSLSGLIGNPLTLVMMAVALCSEFYLAAVFLAWFAGIAHEEGAATSCRRVAVVSGSGVLITALLALLVYAQEVPGARPALLAELWLWVLALLAFLLSLALVRGRSRGIAPVLLAGAMYLGGYMGLGFAQVPYLIRGYVTDQMAFTSAPMARALAIVFVFGVVLVVLPSASLLTWYLITQARQRLTPPLRTPARRS